MRIFYFAFRSRLLLYFFQNFEALFCVLIRARIEINKKWCARIHVSYTMSSKPKRLRYKLIISKKWGCWKNGILLLVPVTVFVVVTVVVQIHCLIIEAEETRLLFYVTTFLTEAVSTFLTPREIVRRHSAYCTLWQVNHLLRTLGRKSNKHIWINRLLYGKHNNEKCLEWGCLIREISLYSLLIIVIFNEYAFLIKKMVVFTNGYL